MGFDFDDEFGIDPESFLYGLGLGYSENTVNEEELAAMSEDIFDNVDDDDYIIVESLYNQSKQKELEGFDAFVAGHISTFTKNLH